MDKAAVSIIVSIYKVEKELDRCVQSILKQTYRDIEVILVDDGSTDRCPEMCDAYAEQDARIRVIHKENGGLSDARNTGLKTATGDYVLYVDSDDYIELDACERLLAGADEDVDFVVGACREIRPDGGGFQKHTNIESGRKYTAKDFVIESIKKNEWFAPAWLNLYKRKFLLDNGLFYKKGYLYEDIEMLPKLYLAATKVVYIDYCFYNYVIRDNSIMGSGPTPQKAQMSLDIYTNWYRLLKGVEDKEFQKNLYGVFVRYYLANARRMKIVGWKIDGLDTKFALKYAIGVKDKLKVLFFALLPKIYIRTI